MVKNQLLVLVQLQVTNGQNQIFCQILKFPLFLGGFGAPTAAAPGFGNFGQPNQAGSLFNNSFNKPAVPTFGGFETQPVQAQAVPLVGGMFGINAPSSTGLFNAPATQPSTGLFGQQQPQTANAFGTSRGGFGQQHAPAFGQHQAQPATNCLFRKVLSTPATPRVRFRRFRRKQWLSASASVFGQPKQQTGFGAFGQTSVKQASPLFEGATTSSAGGFDVANLATSKNVGIITNPATKSSFGAIPGNKQPQSNILSNFKIHSFSSV